MSMAKLVVVIILASLMLQTGMHLNRERIKAILGNRALLARALLANVILVPLVGVIVVRLLRLEDAVATGVLLMAIAPGLPLLPRRAGKKIGGSPDFAVVLMFLLPLVSIVTVPVTARLLLPPGYSAHLPLAQFMTTLLLYQLLPLLVGVGIAYAAPAAAKALDLPLRAVFVIGALLFIVAAGPLLLKALGSAFGSFAIVASLLIVLISLAIGMLLGGSDPEYRNTMAMGTALRNFGLAALIATIDFQGTLVPAAVICYFIVQLIVAALLGAAYTRAARKTPSAAAG